MDDSSRGMRIPYSAPRGNIDWLAWLEFAIDRIEPTEDCGAVRMSKRLE